MLTYCRPHLQNGDFCRDFEPAVRGLEPRLSKFTTLVRYSKTAYLSRIFAQRSAILLGFTEDTLFPTSSSGPTSNIIYNERYNDRYKTGDARERSNMPETTEWLANKTARRECIRDTALGISALAMPSLLATHGEA